MEKITYAALLIRNAVARTGLPVIQSMVVVGRRHCDCFEKAFHAGWKYDKNQVTQGFVTDSGHFLDRYEAMELALKTGQLKEPTGLKELFSEDLW